MYLVVGNNITVRGDSYLLEISVSIIEDRTDDTI